MYTSNTSVSLVKRRFSIPLREFSLENDAQRQKILSTLPDAGVHLDLNASGQMRVGILSRLHRDHNLSILNCHCHPGFCTLASCLRCGEWEAVQLTPQATAGQLCSTPPL